MNPSHAYDCDNCKFRWNCGPLCACIPGIKPAPFARGWEVARVQSAYGRRRRTFEGGAK